MTIQEKQSRMLMVILTFISVVVLGLGVQTVRASILFGGVIEKQNYVIECAKDRETRLRNVERVISKLEVLADAIENQGGKIFVKGM